jgi:hypothetical protein
MPRESLWRWKQFRHGAPRAAPAACGCVQREQAPAKVKALNSLGLYLYVVVLFYELSHKLFFRCYLIQLISPFYILLIFLLINCLKILNFKYFPTHLIFYFLNKYIC